MSSRNISSDSPGDAHATDPRTLRAVAHPVRLDLLYLLRREGSLTASRCAELLGLSPKVCSYHLTLLGRYGLVEETGEGKGRARPWRLVPTGLTYVHRAGESRTSARAADEFARTMLARDAGIVEAFIEGRHALPSGWRNVSTMSSNPLRLTPDQLAALAADVFEVVERYAEISQSPAADAHPVHLAVYAVPVELDQLTDPPG